MGSGITCAPIAIDYYSLVEPRREERAVFRSVGRQARWGDGDMKQTHI
jgi:hypothetical protein